jgi:hypothetical protein
MSWILVKDLFPLDCVSPAARGTWHVRWFLRCVMHWAHRIHTSTLLRVVSEFRVCRLHSHFACARRISIPRLRVAFAYLPLHVAFAFCILRIHACALRFHVCSSFVQARSRTRAAHGLHVLRPRCVGVRSLIVLYSAARKSHITQTSTRSSFFTLKEKSCV